MPNVIRKRGTNRGRPRIWLEGKLLTEAGFRRGDQFTVAQTDDRLVLMKDPEGSRKVSGKAEKPIIDIMGTTLGPLRQVERVRVWYKPDGGALIIEGVVEE